MDRRDDFPPDYIWRQLDGHVRWLNYQALCAALNAAKEAIPGEDQAVIENSLRVIRRARIELMARPFVI